MTPKNFLSTLECNSKLTPHEIYTCLAIDAALLGVNEQIPDMSDSENNRILDAAQAAAQAVLKLASVPDDWLTIIEVMRQDTAQQLRAEVHELVYKEMGAAPTHITEAERVAIDRVRDLCLPGRRDELHDALLELEFAYSLEILDACEQAFRVGFQVAHDPLKLIMEPREQG